MDWLVTVKKNTVKEDLDTMLRNWNCERDQEMPVIPIGEDEEVISVVGPRDLPQKARNEPRVTKVSPNSSLTLY